VRRYRPVLEGLERRDVPTGISLDAAGVLHIDGTASRDQAGVRTETVTQLGLRPQVRVVAGMRTYDANGQLLGIAENSFARAQVRRIEFHGLGDNDNFVNYTNLAALVYGEGGDDNLRGGEGNDSLYGGDGRDTLYGFQGLDLLNGGADNDLLQGGDNNDYLDGQDGADTLSGQAGNDSLLGGAGADYLAGGADNDSLTGGADGDELHGDQGRDTLSGGNGRDKLYGGDGSDSLLGNSGNDRLFGEAGNDTLSGGAGNDWLEAGSAAELAELGDGFVTDPLDFNAYTWTVNGTSYSDINQGGVGDCWVLAAIGSVAQSGVNLSQRITYRGNYTYRVDMFTGPGGQLTHEDVYFDGTVTAVDPFPDAVGESWVIITQRALLQHLGIDYSDPDAISGGDPGSVMALLTGRTVDTHIPLLGSFTADDRQLMADALANHKAIAVGTRPGAFGTWDFFGSVTTHRLVENHAYVVLAVDDAFITLYNPWGYDGNGTADGVDDGVLIVGWSAFKDSMLAIEIN
jgi:hypothetical protein